jgi:hypothetical protein
MRPVHIVPASDARVGAAPYLLDRAQVRAYADRVNEAVRTLGNDIRSRQLDKGISGDAEHTVAYNPADGKLPWGWWTSWLHFKTEWEAYYEKLQGFDLFGPTVWSAWAAIEDFETRFNVYKKDFTTKYAGISTGPDLVTQTDIDKEHPTSGWGSAFAAALPWAILLGAGGALYLAAGRTTNHAPPDPVES